MTRRQKRLQQLRDREEAKPQQAGLNSDEPEGIEAESAKPPLPDSEPTRREIRARPARPQAPPLVEPPPRPKR